MLLIILYLRVYTQWRSEWKT